MWLNVDAQGVLSGFESHPWNFEPRERSYDLMLEFAPLSGPGSTQLTAARVCATKCGDHPDRDGCGGSCFGELQSGTVEISELSDNGKRFELRFEFDVVDEEGHAIHVRGGEARTAD
jgi:hypothetical protein